MMSPILRLEAEISCMLPTACCTTAPPRVASPEADALQKRTLNAQSLARERGLGQAAA